MAHSLVDGGSKQRTALSLPPIILRGWALRLPTIPIPEYDCDRRVASSWRALRVKDGSDSKDVGSGSLLVRCAWRRLVF